MFQSWLFWGIVTASIISLKPVLARIVLADAHASVMEGFFIRSLTLVPVIAGIGCYRLTASPCLMWMCILSGSILTAVLAYAVGSSLPLKSILIYLVEGMNGNILFVMAYYTAIKYGSVTKVIPIVAISAALSYAMGVFCLKEPVTLVQTAFSLLAIFAVVMLSIVAK
jgi:uncharacterized membrane protein